LLRKGDLTWRYRYRSCEYIRPISGYIEVSQWPNYEDFLADNQNFRTDFEAHDRRVSEVESSAGLLFDGLLQSAVFLKRVQEALEQYRSVGGGHALYANAEDDKERVPRVVAEFLVNRTGSLPEHYGLHTFWENSRGRFETLEDQFEPDQQRELLARAVENAAGALRETSEKLESSLTAHRRLLCIEYDIPPAPVGVPRGHSTDAFTV
jgi:hypothetical protein